MSIPPELLEPLTNAFIRCGRFDSDQALKSIFVDSRINDWKLELPQADNMAKRIDLAIEFLWDRANPEYENALILLVEVLRNRTPSGDALHQEFTWLAKRLKKVKSHSPQKPEQLGLVKVYPRAHRIELSDWLELIRKTKFRIDVAAEAFFELANQSSLVDAILERIIKEKVTVRILVNSPENLKEWFAAYKNPDLHGMLLRMEEAKEATQTIYYSLPPKDRPYFQVVQVLEGGRRLHVAIRRFDEKLYVLHYMYSLRAQDTPAYVIEGSSAPLFKIYMDEFDSLWHRFYPEGLLFKESLRMGILVLELAIDFHQFTLESQSQFIIDLSRIINTDPNDVRIINLASGSVKIMLELPKEAIKILLSMFLTEESELKTLKIVRAELIPDSSTVSETGFQVNDQDVGLTSVEQVSMPKLRELTANYFNETELRDICFDLHVDYESLPAQGKRDKARELVAFLERGRRVDELVLTIRDQRPNLPVFDLLR